MRALVVDDDALSARLVTTSLKRQDCVVEHAQTGQEALELASLYDFDAAIVDLELPDMTGVDVVRRMRSRQITVPALMLSSRGERAVKVDALLAGADDYLTKPFDPEELGARFQAVVRRARGHAASTIQVGRITIDLAARIAVIDGQPLKISGKEYSILELLALRKGMTLTKETFLDHLYGGMDEPEQKIIDVFVCKLRKKIAAVSKGDHGIRTVWGRGYVMQDPAGQATGLAEPASGFDHQGDDNGPAGTLGREDEVELLLSALLPV